MTLDFDYRAFVTGSRKYGKPRKNSDIDLVIYVSQEDYSLLALVSDDATNPKEPRRGELGYDPKTCQPLTFGKLNLLVCVNETQYKCWFEGTAKLLGMIFPTRDQAVSVFTALRKAAGLQK